ncbi:MAG: YqeG family HAD IIIA-type phosphatase [Eubacteriales bacterium]|nr:YqeG family HAD IIIA-type phosphatase [Eubacteriales bacterium]
MYKKFYPDYKFNKVLDIPDSFFLKNDIKFAVLDIDNTLVPYTSPLPDENARLFLKRLDDLGISFIFVSNNHEERVRLFCDKLDGNIDFIFDARKPFVYKIKHAMRRLGADKTNTVFIGDQVFTDVYAANRAGILSVMVNPIEAKETPFFGAKRAMERVVLKNYKAKEWKE